MNSRLKKAKSRTKINRGIIGYCRVSTDNQKNEGTIEIQEKALIEYAHANDYELVKIFKDEGVSGGLEHRPALAELFNYIEDHKEIYLFFIQNDW